MSNFNFNVQIPTHMFLSHLDRVEKALIAKYRDVKDFNESLEVRGMLKLVEKFRNLPETLTLIQENDNAASKN